MGLVLAVCLAEKGHVITCIDKDGDKIKQLKMGNLPLYEQDLAEKLVNNKNSLIFTTSQHVAYKDARVIMITVPPEINEDGSANMDGIFEEVIQAAENLEHDCFVSIKSTVPIGTNEKLEKVMREHLVHDVYVEFVSNPDFLRLGKAVNDLLNVSHIVVGIESEAAEKVMREVYEGFHRPFVVMNRRSAELLKYAVHGMISIQNSFMDEMANICEATEANIEDVARGLEYNLRIGKHFMHNCLGYGDMSYINENKSLKYCGILNEINMKTVEAAIEADEIQRWRLLNRGKKYFDSYTGLTIAILGLAYKPGTDNIDHSLALSYIRSLLEMGGEIKVWDPVAMNNLKKHYPTEVTYCASIEETISDADICFIFTKWSDIQFFDVYCYAQYMKSPIILDAVNCYSLCDAEEAGIVYESIGRKMIDGR